MFHMMPGNSSFFICSWLAMSGGSFCSSHSHHPYESETRLRRSGALFIPTLGHTAKTRPSLARTEASGMGASFQSQGCRTIVFTYE